MVYPPSKTVAPAFGLIILASVLPELLSGNTPAYELFKPGPFLFLIVAYGLPVLLIREFTIRHNIGFSGLFILGLAYGIINEGLHAKTVFRANGVPVDFFGQYGFFGGIQWAWTIFILPWHAMASVILPLTFTHLAAPHAAKQRWLNVKTALGLALVLFSLFTFFYLYEDASGIAGTVPMAILLWTFIVVLITLSFLLPRQSAVIPSQKTLTPFLCGLGGGVAFISLLIIAKLNLPFWFYGVTAIAWIMLYRFLVEHFSPINTLGFGWFSLGWYIQIAALSWFGIAAAYPYMVLADLLIFAFLWFVLRRHQ